MAVRVLLALADDPGPLAEALRAAGHAVEVCPTGRLRGAAEAFRPGACVLELAGSELPAEVLELAGTPAGPAIVALAGAGTTGLAGQALDRGVDAVLPRGAPADWVRGAVDVAVARRAARVEQAARRQALLHEDALVLLGRSPAARRLRESLERIAATPRTTVLITAEGPREAASVARLVHDRSARARGPLLELPAGALPDADQAEAFSRADGPLARAEGGTLVLHRVERLGPLAQVGLTRALERRGEEAGEPDVRLVATSLADLEQEALAGRFREDLLYRLNVLSLRIPPLDERSEDLGELARGWMERASRGGPAPARLAPQALEALRGRSWPGGLGQLFGALEQALLQGAGPGQAAERAATSAAGPLPEVGEGVPDALGAPGALLRLPDRSLRAAEEALIRQVLASTGGNKLRSAEILGIHRTTLYHKLRDYGIQA